MDWVLTNWIEVLGYAGSAIVLLSLMMSSILMLRWVNFVGATLFSLYGFLIGAIPVLVVNGLIVFIDVYYIIGIYRARELFSLMEVDADNPLLKKFLSFFTDDIQKYFPSFNSKALNSCVNVLVFRDITPAGAFSYRIIEPGRARVELDYISPNYRDYKNADYLISTRRERFLEEGINILETECSVKAHQIYLQKIGFKPDVGNPSLFIKSLG